MVEKNPVYNNNKKDKIFRNKLKKKNFILI